jgi:hypothetical protein
MPVLLPVLLAPETYDAVRKKILYNNFVEFVAPMKLVRLIERCLNRMNVKVRIGKYLFDNLLSKKV